MIQQVNWNPNHKELRKFGAIIMIGFGIIGSIVYWKGHRLEAHWIWGISSAVGVWSILFPSLAKPFYWAWMGFGKVMGSIVSPIVIGVIFYGIVTPTAIFFRRMGRDPLRLHCKNKEMESYWIDHPEMTDKKSYEHLF